jgi:simple sugar transport system permease protein
VTGAAPFWAVVIAGAVPLCTPVIFAALGEVVLEDAGRFNVGIEGMMLLGAAAGVAGSLGGGVWCGLAAGGAIGAAFGLIFGLAVGIGAVDEVIAGIALDLIGVGASTVLYQILAPAGHTNHTAPVEPSMNLPLLDHVPLIGLALSGAGPFFYLSVGFAVATWWWRRFSRAGLRLRSVGFTPIVAEARGISVRRYQFAAAVVAGGAAGVGGAVVPLAGIGVFTPGMTGGAGFVALAVVIIARRNPFGVLGGAFVFALFNSLALLSQTRDLGLPVELWQALPYAATLALLCIASAQRRRVRVRVPSA